jgi:hypothetical protein
MDSSSVATTEPRNVRSSLLRSSGCRLGLSISLGLSLAISSAGCRQDGQRVRTTAGPGTPGPTIGHDFRLWPAGTTIPPTGLGVDLVKSQPARLPRLDTRTVQADSEGSPVGSPAPDSSPSD